MVDLRIGKTVFVGVSFQLCTEGKAREDRIQDIPNRAQENKAPRHSEKDRRDLPKNAAGCQSKDGRRDQRDQIEAKGDDEK